MKAVVTALALAALIGTPALAQTTNQQPAKPAPRVHVQQPAPVQPTNPQLRTSRVTDPDGFIRDMLQNDSPSNSGD